MKKIFGISTVLAAALAVASCDLNKTPVFTDDMSFAAFDETAVAVAEDGKTVSLPITIASIDPVKVAVAYTVTDGTAVQGKNFKLTDNSGVVSFDGTERTAYIDFEVIDNPGVFTGDLSFTVQLESAGSLDLGANSTCTVTIQDNDHPLAAILGDYSVSVDDYWGDHYDFTVTIVKDPDDVSVVWLQNLDPYMGGYGYTAKNGYNSFYGNVNADKTTITLPQDQAFGYYDMVLKGVDAAWENYCDVVMEISDGGKTITTTTCYGTRYSGYWYCLFNPGVVLTKK